MDLTLCLGIKMYLVVETLKHLSHSEGERRLSNGMNELKKIIKQHLNVNRIYIYIVKRV